MFYFNLWIYYIIFSLYCL